MLVRLLVWTLMLCVVAGAAYGGLRLRRWAWDITERIHYTGDIRNGYGWGYAASGEEGFLNQYEKMARQRADWRHFLDYAPLRLAVMALWAGHNRHTFSNPQTWVPAYDFNWPVLWFNSAVEGVGVIAAFFLVRRWAVLSDRANRQAALSVEAASPPFTGWAGGLFAGLLLWFNPAMILSAHGWPTWDVWIVPTYLLALLAASYHRWVTAGAIMGVGIMFKGQQFVGVPVFLAWTLLNGNWRGAVRFGGGLIVSIAMVASPWLLTHIPAGKLDVLYAAQDNVDDKRYLPLFIAERVWNWPAIGWTAAVGCMTALLPLASVDRTAGWRARAVWAAIKVTGLIALWPAVWMSWYGGTLLLLGCAGLAVASRFARTWRSRTLLVLTVVAGAMLAGMACFDASAAWWTCGIAYGTDHYRSMVAGLSPNLPALLKVRFGWESINDIVFTLPGFSLGPLQTPVTPVTMRDFTRALFVLSLIPCLWAVARHARRGDPRFLVAVTAPWMMFFCLPTEIHERYLLFAAGVGAICVGQSLGMAALSVLLSVITWAEQLQVMLTPRGCDRDFGLALHAWKPAWFTTSAGVTLHNYLRGTYPDAAWAVLLAGAIILWVTVTPSQRPYQSPLEPWASGSNRPGH